MPLGETCHIATPFPSPEMYAQAVAWMKSAFTPEEVSFHKESDGTGLKYALVVVPGAVTLQLIYRETPLRPVWTQEFGGDNSEC